MFDAVTRVPIPINEPVLDYAPGSAERASLEQELTRQAGVEIELTQTIGGRSAPGGGDPIEVVMPHERHHVLGRMRAATTGDARQAIDAALAAAPAWRELPYDERAAVFLRAAELLSGPWRATLNAATMLGQSKTVYQAEIDAACELADFWRFNVHFGRELLVGQPVANAPGVWNRSDHRPLEGFVYAVTPFNFTSIAANLPTAPALMGNTVVWKPAPTQTLAAWYTMRLLEAAGLPAGVINLLTGDGLTVSEVTLADRDLAGIHFTGSTATFRRLWYTVGANVERYRSYPRLVGETGGKDFVLAHPSANPAILPSLLIRGAYEYQGQKCSAASRAYLPRSIWQRVSAEIIDRTESLSQGDPREFSHFLAAVIDERAYERHRAAIDRAHATPGLDIVAGGRYEDRIGWFVRPTIVVADDPRDQMFSTEYFGPILTVHVFDDDRYDEIATHIDRDSDYALTGAIVATDRAAIDSSLHRLRFAAGNIYINDKPTGAVVGQQPFGGARGSGTNDKAGSAQNLARWTSPRSIKETFVPATMHTYPHMA